MATAGRRRRLRYTRATSRAAPPRQPRELSPLGCPEPPLLLAVAIALIGALAGTAGFAAFVVRRQNRRLAVLAERLTDAADEGALVALDADRIEDPRLRAAFRALADRVADTWRLATVDPLTGIANRQAVLGRVDEEIARATRYGHPLSVVLVDLDHFKRLNDTHGHAAGDRVLRHVAQLLRANVRERGLAGRYGGEEFLVVLPETDVDAAAIPGREAPADRREQRGPAARRGARSAITLSAGVAGGPAPSCGSMPSCATPMPRSTPRRRSAATRSTSSARPATRTRSGVARSARGPVAGARRGPGGDGRRPGRAASDARGSRPVGRQALHADRRGVGGARARDRPAAGRARAHPDGEPAPRPRQAGDPR